MPVLQGQGHRRGPLEAVAAVAVASVRSGVWSLQRGITSWRRRGRRCGGGAEVGRLRRHPRHLPLQHLGDHRHLAAALRVAAHPDVGGATNW